MRPTRVTYIVIPHPDDEFQSASLYADTPADYKVFILMTRGESTIYCDPASYAISMLAGDPAPDPVPQGMHTTSCEQARLNSWTGFFARMSQADATLPGDFDPVSTRGPFPANGVQLAREGYASPVVPTPTPSPSPTATVAGSSRPATSAASDTRSAPFTDTTARVWTDKEDRGALVSFNLGDGDLTPAKVQWAVQTVLDNRAALGIDTTLPNYSVAGAYSNLSYSGCFTYTHPDHAAVASALRTVDFGVTFQAVPTCRSDPATAINRTVDPAFVAAAYPPSGAAGAFANSYGWLETPVISRTDQSSLFMAKQSFSLYHWHWPVSRVAGPDRYGTAISVAQASFPTAAPVVFIATGADFPDALSAAAAAAKEHGPLLLTAPGALPPSVAAEIQRLSPSKIVVVGGPNAVSATVLSQLQLLQPNTIRIAGADRYATSQAVVRYAFSSEAAGTPVAYIATGSTFPDALAASGAAGARGGAVLLVPGYAAQLAGSGVQSTLAAIGVKQITIVGGTAAVTASIAAQLSEMAPTQRVSGDDRFATAVAINADAFPTARQALLATGLNFPDALTGAAWAGTQGIPLFESQAACVPVSTLGGFAGQGVEHVTALGGTSALAVSVEALTKC